MKQIASVLLVLGVMVGSAGAQGLRPVINPSMQIGGGVILKQPTGFSYFATTSSVEGSGNIGSFAETTHFDDFTFATSAGGGMRLQLGRGRTPVALDLGARYLYNGRARYLREGRIEIDGSSVTYPPIESQTNVMIDQVGVSIGVL